MTKHRVTVPIVGLVVVEIEAPTPAEAETKAIAEVSHHMVFGTGASTVSEVAYCDAFPSLAEAERVILADVADNPRYPSPSGMDVEAE